MVYMTPERNLIFKVVLKRNAQKKRNFVEITRTPQKILVPLNCSLMFTLATSFLKEVVVMPYILAVYQKDL